MNFSFPAKFAWLLFLAAALPHSVPAQWVAYNDHASGPGTHANATRYHIFGAESGTNGFLKDILTGLDLPVKLTITRSGVVQEDPSGGSPAPGTPLESWFGPFVDFSGSSLPRNVACRTGGFVTYTFSGLDPGRTYRLMGGAVRGASLFTNRWGLFELSGSQAYTPNHSPGVLTSMQVPGELADNQAAINFGGNHTPQTGDMFQWDAIEPGSDGVIELICTRYTGLVPGGNSGTATGVGYVPTAIRLQDDNEFPVQIVTQPMGQSAEQGQSATFTVEAIGFPIFYQWFRNGGAILNATQAVYRTPPLTLADSFSRYSVIVSNRFGALESASAWVYVKPKPTNVLAFTNTWRYEPSQSDVGNAWKEVGYDDSSWLAGPGPLGNETATLPEPLRTTVARANILTYYFRTTFDFQLDPLLYDLQVTNLLDDGAVFYLNGVEWFRRGMPAGPITFDTPANRTVGDANFEFVTLSPNPLVQGVNELAVELHQVNTTSSDFVFGMRIIAIPTVPTPLSITASPQSLVVEEVHPASFSVSVSGSQIRYQWFHDGIPIEGATRSAYAIDQAELADAGLYTVRAFNALYEVFSPSASLTVLVDTNPPALLTADPGPGPDQILLSFSERVSEMSAVNLTHYQLATTLGIQVPILDVVLVSPTQAVVHTAPRPAGFNYMLTAQNLEDVSPQANRILLPVSVPVRQRLVLVSFDSTWDFYDPFPGLNPLDPGPDWHQWNYLPGSFWGQGGGAFVYDLGNQLLPVPENTILSQGSLTKYFRHGFHFGGSPIGARLRLEHVVDDGAIVYLNGQESHRFNLPDWPVDYLTPAVTPLLLVPEVEGFPIDAAPLHLGFNLLAAELHGDSANDLDFVFAAQLIADVQSLATGPIRHLRPPSNLTAVEGQPALFDFDAVGAGIFQWFENGLPIPGATNASLLIDTPTLAQSGSTFHVMAANEEGYNAESAGAVLTVLPDTAAPTLVSAFFNLTRDQILVTFSERVDPNTGAQAGHYALGGGTSAPPSILGASVVNGNQVLLVLDVPSIHDWLLTASHVRDRARSANVIRSGSQVKIGFNGPWFDFDSEWKWEASGTDLGTTWRAVGYNDATWPAGPGVLGFPVDEPLPQGAALGTLLPRFAAGSGAFLTNIYFRKTFEFFAPTSAVVTLSNLIDDGAVFYLNGTELGRIGMYQGPVNYTTPAERGGDITTRSHGFDAIPVPIDRLIQGANLLTVEVHQGSFDTSDLIFGSIMHVFVPSEPLPPGPELRIALEGGQVVISWEGTGYVLESKATLDSLQNSWMPVAPQANPYRATADAAKRFYRLRR